MLETKEKVVAPESESEKEVVEIEDVDAGLKDEDVEAVKAETEKEVIERHVLNPDQQRIFSEMLEAAEMPVKLTDGKFKLGKKELDIRYLSKANKEQMFFRALVLNNVDNRGIHATLIDISRLLMIICDKLGVENIIEATDEVIEKVAKQNEIKKKLGLEGEK